MNMLIYMYMHMYMYKEESGSMWGSIAKIMYCFFDFFLLLTVKLMTVLHVPTRRMKNSIWNC